MAVKEVTEEIDTIGWGRFLLTFVLYDKGWTFGLGVNYYWELDAYCFAISLGAGAILLGVKK